ncbi:YhzD family protein [Salisediminibacterium halotolerans]|uniref:YhzD family protein n=1 Tax=Salisediminibacterium halotolerans TaxID=517425 RepID=UPI000EB24B44|nr:YhzD family protein [Salisediminibacterium halotolerans]RLJ72385.1 YhzD-like protein [Actinophytocola xinjiangensis]RPE85600.1 YhzD-like protein [Salisediminibacterium halotolerans]TWG33554.1 YhzD-like protein [Salisediminibacterium halotolerans]GEL08710.1 hypothetical protein SHA02_21260 [Salisediminibacterium halotolerans]
MQKFFVTAFQADGTKLVNESFQAETIDAAHEQGMTRLKEAQAESSPARIVRSDGTWVYFRP